MILNWRGWLLLRNVAFEVNTKPSLPLREGEKTPVLLAGVNSKGKNTVVFPPTATMSQLGNATTQVPPQVVSESNKKKPFATPPSSNMPF